jgi:YegS/Rv2252/BmrU family lipid kinase
MANEAVVDPRALNLIVNPSAGGGRAAKVLPDVTAALGRWAADIRVETTKSLDHAADLAAAAVAEGRVAVALGGDGLAGRVAETVAGLDGLLAVLPGGRGNDFLRGLGVPLEPTVAAAALADALERRIDLAVANGRGYLGIASCGFDSDVQVIANRARWIGGQRVYTYAALRVAASWKPATFRVRVDDEPEYTLVGWTVAAANGPYYGGGMRFAPDAAVDDGALDVVTTSRCGKLTFLASFPKVFAGTHVSSPHFATRRARRVRIDADRPFQLYADGDPVADLPVEITVRERALRILVPAPSVRSAAADADADAG